MRPIFFVNYRPKQNSKRYDKGIVYSANTVFSRIEREAYYPCGERAWSLYVLSRVIQNADAITKDGVSSTCGVKFIVGTNGKIRTDEALTLRGSVLANVAV